MAFRIRLWAAVLALVVAALPATAWADWLWDLHQRAAELEAAGRVDEALPLWAQLAAGYARRGNWTNAAIYWKKQGRALEARGQREAAIQAYENEAYFWARAGHADWGLEDLGRVSALRSTVRLFVQRPADPRAEGPALAPLEPKSGAYLGAYSELDPAVGNLYSRAEAAYGRRHAAFLVYVPWGHPFPTMHAQRAREAGAALQVHWMPDRGLAAVQDGPYLREFARAMARAGVPIFLRFGGEMNGDWVPWHGDPALYIAKWRLVAQVVRQEAPGVALVWAPNHVPAHNIDAYYPGDEWVDWVGVSLYQDYYASGRQDQPAYHEVALDKLQDIYQRYAARKPILIAEWGAANREYTTGQEVTAWGQAQIQRLYQALPLLYPRVKAVFYFSVDQKRTPNPYQPGSIWSSYLLTEKPEVRATYRAVTASPYYHDRVGPAGEKVAPFGYQELTDFAAVAAGPETLSAYVKIYDPFISKVEYQIEGQAPIVRTEFPYTLTVDFSPYAGRTVALRVRAYNSTGQVEGERLFRLVVGQPAAAAFADTRGHWAEQVVGRMAAYGVVSGYPGGTYRPDEPVSREAFVKLVVAALGLAPAQAGGPPSFADVPADRWSAGYIEAAVRAGLLVPEEYEGQRLAPGDPISRVEAATLLVRALGLWKEAEFEPQTVPFADRDAIPAHRRGYVALAAAKGLMAGMPDGRFAGQAPLTRAQAAAVIARLIDVRNRPQP